MPASDSAILVVGGQLCRPVIRFVIYIWPNHLALKRSPHLPSHLHVKISSTMHDSLAKYSSASINSTSWNSSVLLIFVLPAEMLAFSASSELPSQPVKVNKISNLAQVATA